MTRARWALLCFIAALPLVAADWNARLAADYLDARQKQWMAWPAANSAGAPCVSCHTGAPYLMARAALRQALGESGPTEYEGKLLDSLRSREAKSDIKELFPAKMEQSSAQQALGVEAIFASLFVKDRTAFDRLWALQIRDGAKAGAWVWNTYDLDPYETKESTFYGAAMAALAVGLAGPDYQREPGIQQGLKLMTAYLERELPTQPLHNQLMALWAAEKLPSLHVRREQIIADAFQKQASDGGWAMSALGPWKERPKAPAAPGSNSYATAWTVLALEKAGVETRDPRMTRGLAWLRTHQNQETGYWPAESMNRIHAESEIPAGFMRDVATAYAALALIDAERPTPGSASLRQ